MTRRILIVMAHPDDESFGMGGTIARYADEGVEITLICATNGDVGTVDDKFMQGHETIADLRLAELQCAAETLGLAEVVTLGYRDSGMTGSPDNDHPDSLYCADLERVTAQVVNVMQRVQPDVVVTFDPFGGYGHPDHITMHKATVRAFEAARAWENPPEKLYYQTFPRGFMKVVVSLMPLFGTDPTQFGRNNDIDLTEITEHTYPIHTRINFRPYKETAQAAARCHASQLGDDEGRSLLRRLRDLIFTRPVDTFMRAHPPAEGVRERDFFEGSA